MSQYDLTFDLRIEMGHFYRLLNLYWEIFGTSSYGEGRTSLRVRLRHMNECRIFPNIDSITFLLYTPTLMKRLILASVGKFNNINMHN